MAGMQCVVLKRCGGGGDVTGIEKDSCDKVLSAARSCCTFCWTPHKQPFILAILSVSQAHLPPGKISSASSMNATTTILNNYHTQRTNCKFRSSKYTLQRFNANLCKLHKWSYETMEGRVQILFEQLAVSFDLMTRWSSNVALESCWMNHQTCQCSNGYQWFGSRHAQPQHSTIGPLHKSSHLISNTAITQQSGNRCTSPVWWEKIPNVTFMSSYVYVFVSKGKWVLVSIHPLNEWILCQSIQNIWFYSCSYSNTPKPHTQ